MPRIWRMLTLLRRLFRQGDEPIRVALTPSGQMDSRVLARRGVAVASAAVLILAAVPAAAQDPLVPHVTLGAAAGIATPFNSDFDFTATS